MVAVIDMKGLYGTCALWNWLNGNWKSLNGFTEQDNGVNSVIVKVYAAIVFNLALLNPLHQRNGYLIVE